MKRISFKQRNCQTSKTRWITLILCMMLFPPIYSQVDYSKKSNILNPETLSGDNKKVFWHFVKLSFEEVKAMKPEKIKEEFAKMGITTDENDRFADAFSFFYSTMKNHKKSCENWESFKDLKPKITD